MCHCFFKFLNICPFLSLTIITGQRDFLGLADGHMREFQMHKVVLNFTYGVKGGSQKLIPQHRPHLKPLPNLAPARRSNLKGSVLPKIQDHPPTAPPPAALFSRLFN